MTCPPLHAHLPSFTPTTNISYYVLLCVPLYRLYDLGIHLVKNDEYDPFPSGDFEILNDVLILEYFERKPSKSLPELVWTPN